jgi:hypothetical protein
MDIRRICGGMKMDKKQQDALVYLAGYHMGELPILLLACHIDGGHSKEAVMGLARRFDEEWWEENTVESKLKKLLEEKQ